MWLKFQFCVFISAFGTYGGEVRGGRSIDAVAAQAMEGRRFCEEFLCVFAAFCVNPRARARGNECRGDCECEKSRQTHSLEKKRKRARLERGRVAKQFRFAKNSYSFFSAASFDVSAGCVSAGASAAASGFSPSAFLAAAFLAVFFLAAFLAGAFCFL